MAKAMHPVSDVPLPSRGYERCTLGWIGFPNQYELVKDGQPGKGLNHQLDLAPRAQAADKQEEGSMYINLWLFRYATRTPPQMVFSASGDDHHFFRGEPVLAYDLLARELRDRNDPRRSAACRPGQQLGLKSDPCRKVLWEKGERNVTHTHDLWRG